MFMIHISTISLKLQAVKTTFILLKREDASQQTLGISIPRRKLGLENEDVINLSFGLLNTEVNLICLKLDEHSGSLKVNLLLSSRSKRRLIPFLNRFVIDGGL